MEEAREELVKIEHHYPIWDQNPLEGDDLPPAQSSGGESDNGSDDVEANARQAEEEAGVAA